MWRVVLSFLTSELNRLVRLDNRGRTNMKTFTFASSVRLIAAMGLVVLPAVAMNASAQQREYQLSSPYPHEKGPYDVSSRVGTLATGEKANTKVERFLQIADAALKATPPKYSEAESALRFATIA